MEINLLYRSKKGNIFTCSQLLGNPLLVHASDRNQADRSKIAGGVEIVQPDGYILYLSIDFDGMEDVWSFFHDTAQWHTDAPDQRVLRERNGTTLSIQRTAQGIILSCQTNSPETNRNFDNYFIPAEDWIAAATMAVDDFSTVFEHHSVLAEEWARLKS